MSHLGTSKAFQALDDRVRAAGMRLELTARNQRLDRLYVTTARGEQVGPQVVVDEGVDRAAQLLAREWKDAAR